MSEIIVDPTIPDWIKLLNAYNPDTYTPGKLVTAEEWNALFLSSVTQGNYHAETLDLLINTYLPENFYTQLETNTLIANYTSDNYIPKVTASVADNFAVLTAAGNLKDGGFSVSDISDNYIPKVPAGVADNLTILNADGTLKDSGVSINDIPEGVVLEQDSSVLNMDGLASVGSSQHTIRADHIHPANIAKADLTYVNTELAKKVDVVKNRILYGSSYTTEPAYATTVFTTANIGTITKTVSRNVQTVICRNFYIITEAKTILAGTPMSVQIPLRTTTDTGTRQTTLIVEHDRFTGDLNVPADLDIEANYTIDASASLSTYITNNTDSKITLGLIFPNDIVLAVGTVLAFRVSAEINRPGITYEIPITEANKCILTRAEAVSSIDSDVVVNKSNAPGSTSTEVFEALHALNTAVANLTPVNYTTEEATPAGHFKGLDTALGNTATPFETNTANIKMNGTVAVGTSLNVPRADHVHATDTSRASAVDLTSLQALSVETMPTASEQAVPFIQYRGTSVIASTTYVYNATSYLTIHINKATFESMEPISGTYQFIYDVSRWEYNNVAVDLSDYGIDYTGTPTNHDSIDIVYQEQITPSFFYKKVYFADAYNPQYYWQSFTVNTLNSVTGLSTAMLVTAKGITDYVNNNTTLKYATMPIASADNLGETIQYTGTTTTSSATVTYTSSTITGVTLTKATFEKKFDLSGEYKFIASIETGGVVSWCYTYYIGGSGHSFPVNLADYGISRTGTDTFGDEIIIRYTQSFIAPQNYKCVLFGTIYNTITYFWRGNVTNLVADNKTNNALFTTTKGVADYAMPEIGALILTTSSTFNPASKYGGTWEQLTSDAYLKIVTSSAGSLGGVSDHKITISTMPSHDHDIMTKVGATALANHNSFLARAGYTGTDELKNGSGTKPIGPRLTGGSQPYYPYYYGTYVWHRTA